MIYHQGLIVSGKFIFRGGFREGSREALDPPFKNYLSIQLLNSSCLIMNTKNTVTIGLVRIMNYF